jgi:3-oxoacyl-[acyl-carrier-protein] synthase III
MKFNNVVIEDYGYYLPEERMTSEQMEELLAPVYKRLKLPQGRLELMTGITERGIWPTGTLPSDLSSNAARDLFSKGKVKKENIDILIHSSVCRNFLEPSTASIVHGNLELNPECTIFDLSNACLGMVNSWVVAANMIETGQIKRALIVSGENGGPLLHETIKRLNQDETITRKSIKKYFANLTIGSAAVAYVLTHKDYCPNGPKLVAGAVLTDSTANKLCQGDGDPNSLFMETDSEKLLDHGKTLALNTWLKAKEQLGWNEEEIGLVIGHQVGKAHKEIVLGNLGLEKRPTYDTFPFLGNTGSAALPVTLAMKNDKEGIEKDSKVLLVGIGSGLSSIVLGVQW